jgi:hypothetical protein
LLDVQSGLSAPIFGEEDGRVFFWEQLPKVSLVAAARRLNVYSRWSFVTSLRFASITEAEVFMMKVKKSAFLLFSVLIAFSLATPSFAAKGGTPASANGKGKTQASVDEPTATRTLSSLAISGPNSQNENTSATFAATATWSDGSTSAATPAWSENSAYATISTSGVLTASAVTSNQTVTVTASFTSGGVTKTATKSESIVDVPLAPTEPILPAQITLAWDPSADPQVIGYRLYYKESFAGDPSYNTPPFDSTGLFEGDSPIDIGKTATATLNLPYDTTVFCFAVTTYNSDGLESDYSNIACTTN